MVSTGGEKRSVPLMSLSPRQRIEHLFYASHGRLPDLDHPRTFNEKIQWRKLNWTDRRFVRLSDKVEAKRYVAERIGERYVNPTFFSGVELPPLGERRWPTPFVIKSNHASGWNIFLTPNSDIDWPAIEDKTRHWMNSPWDPALCEDWYNQIPRQILVEPMLGAGGAPPPDYKCLVFHGRTELIQINIDRFGDHRRVLFDRDWRRLRVQWREPPAAEDIPKPIHFAEMIAAAEALADDLDFVRVDFYDLPEGLKFGEMTFAPGSGLQRFTPAAFDEVLGGYWRIAR